MQGDNRKTFVVVTGNDVVGFAFSRGKLGDGVNLRARSSFGCC